MSALSDKASWWKLFQESWFALERLLTLSGGEPILQEKVHENRVYNN
jgi:hypothetical protein